MYEAAASCKDIALARVTNWEPNGVRFAGYCYAVRHGMKVQLITPYRVNHLQRYGVTVHGNVTSVCSPSDKLLIPCNYTKRNNKQVNQGTETEETNECRNREQDGKGKNANRRKRKTHKTTIKTRKKPSNSTNGINLVKQPQNCIMNFPIQKQGCMFAEWPPLVRVNWLER